MSIIVIIQDVTLSQLKKEEFAQIYFVLIVQMFDRNAFRNDVKLDLRNRISPYDNVDNDMGFFVCCNCR